MGGYGGVTFYESERNEAPFLDSPAYMYGRMNLLDSVRPFLWAGYCWRGWVVPRSYLMPVPALGQIEDQVRVPAGSWLLAFSSFSAQAAGFKFTVFDVGAQCPALDVGAWDNDATGGQTQSDSDPNPHFLSRPYCVVSPGQLQVRVSNMAAVTNDMQLMLHLALPVEGGKAAK